MANLPRCPSCSVFVSKSRGRCWNCGCITENKKEKKEVDFQTQECYNSFVSDDRGQ